MNHFLRILFWSAFFSVGVLSLLPAEQLPPMVFGWWDKAQHAIAFGVLMLLAFIAYPMYFWRMFIGLILYGAIIEIIQSSTDWRHGDVMDALADAVGVLVISLIIRGYQNHRLRGGH
jgi:VanZ family protein